VDILNIVLFYESMMALLSIILFVTTDIYEKAKIRRLKCIPMIRKQIWSRFMTNVINSFCCCAFMQTTVITFCKNFSFFHNFSSELRLWQNLQTCTANYVLHFLNEKTNIYVNFGNVLGVAPSIPSGSLSLKKYHQI
jgi:hypothetical protein